jgi:hypothetical protein
MRQTHFCCIQFLGPPPIAVRKKKHAIAATRACSLYEMVIYVSKHRTFLQFAEMRSFLLIALHSQLLVRGINDVRYGGTVSGGGLPHHGRSAEMRQSSVFIGCQTQPVKLEKTGWKSLWIPTTLTLFSIHETEDFHWGQPGQVLGQLHDHAWVMYTRASHLQ